ncbi:MAG: hypothetical protein QF357_07390 [Dehalococcoidia bacterium]|nr:hypothetical protein [Dehalococcoidia bacterium]
MIADPTGQLTELQNQVATSFTDRKWINARIEDAISNCESYLGALNPPSPFSLQVINWIFAEGIMGHVLLAGGLQNPTVRKRYSAVRTLMTEHGKTADYSTLLDMLGCAAMTPERVRHHLSRMSEAFDAAKNTVGIRFPFSSDITDVARPISVDGSEELIRQGEHREAVFWIVVTFARCLMILDRAGRTDQAAVVDSDLRSLLSDLGVEEFSDLESKAAAIRSHLPELRQVARTLASSQT